MPYQQAVDDLRDLTPQQLLEGCRAVRSDNRHEPFCFALFQCAIVARNEQCWGLIYQHYQRLVGHWLLDFTNSPHPPTDPSLEEMVVSTFTAFWRAFTPEKLQRAQQVGRVLTYLKACAGTTVLQVKRKAATTRATVDWDRLEQEEPTVAMQQVNNPEKQLASELTAGQIWAIVDACCNDEKERVLARLSFVLSLKPQEIVEERPDLYTDVKEVYMLRRTLKNRLLREQYLQELWGGQANAAL